MARISLFQILLCACASRRREERGVIFGGSVMHLASMCKQGTSALHELLKKRYEREGHSCIINDLLAPYQTHKTNLALRKENGDETLWEPTANSHACIHHFFVGGHRIVC